MSEQDRQEIFEMMARAYPAEVADAYPVEFRQYFEKVCPGVSEEIMNELLEKARVNV
jgi:hypothetical protein